MQRNGNLSGSCRSLSSIRSGQAGAGGRGNGLQRTGSSSTMGSQQDLPTLSENGSLLSPFQQFADELDEIYTSNGKDAKEKEEARVLHTATGSTRSVFHHHRRSSSMLNLEGERSRVSNLVNVLPPTPPLVPPLTYPGGGMAAAGPEGPHGSHIGGHPQTGWKWVVSGWKHMSTVGKSLTVLVVWVALGLFTIMWWSSLDAGTGPGTVHLPAHGGPYMGSYAGSTLLGATSFPYDGAGKGAATYGDNAAEPEPKNLPRSALDYVEARIGRLKGFTTMHAKHRPLGICIMTADFWGLPSAGGTATAYHLLAQALAEKPGFRVTFLGISKKFGDCQEGAKLNNKVGITFSCLEPHHFIPEVVETYPYEQMSHAVLSWVEQHQASCDVIHIHEWGGVGVDMITALHYHQLRAGVRVFVESHGGHFWSTQGQLHRPLDVTSLRIDQGERMVLQLAHGLISPTRYMTAFLRQRGWQLPPESKVIPNVIPHREHAEDAGEVKPVWRLAFFSRLEQRKGLKLFVDAVSRLDPKKLNKNFEVYFVGAEAKIDMRSSSDWLKDKTVTWPFPTYIRANTEREEALGVLAQEGMLLVLCSFIDNMPYVVAEAAVKGIPFIVFDVGGVLEMLDQTVDETIIINDPTLEALSAKLEEVMTAGKVRTAVLHKDITSGREEWIRFHTALQSKQSMLRQEDLKFTMRAEAENRGTVQLLHLKRDQPALELWEGMCAGPHTDKRNTPGGQKWEEVPVLLLPEEYAILDGIGDTAQQLAQLMTVNAALNPVNGYKNGVGALTFGVELPNGRHTFPTAPTWLCYAGDDTHCIENIPLLMLKGNFCDIYLAEARTFRTYHSWVMSMMLRQRGLRLHTYPRTFFRVKHFSTEGYMCIPDKPPTDRKITFGASSNLFPDAEEMMTNLHLTPFPRPAASLVNDFPMEPSHMGWNLGYMVSNITGQFKPLHWTPADSDSGQSEREGKWACADNALAYPAMHNSLIHPCVSTSHNCCGDQRASFVVRWESFFTAPKAMLLLAFEVWPICGDGLDLEITTTVATSGEVKQLIWQPLGTNTQDKPQRQKMEFVLDLHVGDLVDFIAHPRENQDCDGVYLVDIQLWKDDMSGIRTT